MQFLPADMNIIMPEIIMAVIATVILIADLIIKRKESLAFLGIIGAGVVGYTIMMDPPGAAFSGMFISDGYSKFFKLIFMVNVILVAMISVKYIIIEKINLGEYYSLMLFSTLGMMIMASAGDLITLYVGLELMALSTYILTGFIRHNAKSNEAAIKYFLLGAFSSAFLLYGISLIYGLTGTLELKDIAVYINKNGLENNKILLLSMILFVVGFGFKIAAAPFHMWAPDAYEGAPTSITAFMSVGTKAAAFAVIGRVFMTALPAIRFEWATILIPLSLLSIAVGNIAAIAQTNIKRMLAYSAIAHAGYALLGVIAAGSEGIVGTMTYLMIYAFMNIGAFAVIIMLRGEGIKGEDINDYEGLAKKHPVLSAFMLIFMFSLTGIPPTAGFIGKFYVFMSAINAGYVWPVVVAVVFSAISAYFYLRIVMYMYMKEPKEAGAIGELPLLSKAPAIGIVLIIAATVLLGIGVYPSLLLELARAAIGGF